MTSRCVLRETGDPSLPHHIRTARGGVPGFGGSDGLGTAKQPDCTVCGCLCLTHAQPGPGSRLQSVGGKALAQPGRLGSSCPRGPCSSEGCPGAQTRGAERWEVRCSVCTGSGRDGETRWPRCVCKRLCFSHEQRGQQKPVANRPHPSLKPAHHSGLTQKMLSLGISDSLFRVLWGLFSGIAPFLRSVSGPSSLPLLGLPVTA